MGLFGLEDLFKGQLMIEMNGLKLVRKDLLGRISDIIGLQSLPGRLS